MTQPQVLQEVPAPQMPQTPIQEAPRQVDLLTRILEASGLGDTDAERLTELSKLRMFQKRQFDDQNAWEVGAPIPGNPGLLLVFGFENGFVAGDTDGYDHLPGDFRFYARPAGVVADPLSPEFLCFTLNRSSHGHSVERMTLETFVRELGKELWNLAVIQGLAEEDDDEE